MAEQGKIRNYSLKFWVYNSVNATLMSMLATLIYGIIFSILSGELELYAMLGYYLAMSIMASQLQSGMGMRGLMSRALSFGSTRKEAWVGMQIHGVINCLLQTVVFSTMYVIEFHKDMPFRMVWSFMGVYVLVLAFVRLMSAITLKSEKKWVNAIIYVLEIVAIIAAIAGCVFVFAVSEEMPNMRIVPIIIVWVLAILIWIVGAKILSRNTKDLEVSL